MLKEAFDKLDETNQGSLPLSKLINIAAPYNSDGKPVSEMTKYSKLSEQLEAIRSKLHKDKMPNTSELNPNSCMSCGGRGSIEERAIFEEFCELMAPRMSENKKNSETIFEANESNVSCFFCPYVKNSKD